MGCDIHPCLEVRVGGRWLVPEASDMLTRMVENAEATSVEDLRQRLAEVDESSYLTDTGVRKAAFTSTIEAEQALQTIPMISQLYHQLQLATHMDAAGDRNYRWFALLCGVRGNMGDISVSLKPRGLPTDATKAVKEAVGPDDPDMHSQSWASLAEFYQLNQRLREPVLADRVAEVLVSEQRGNTYLSIPDYFFWKANPTAVMDGRMKQDWDFPRKKDATTSEWAADVPLATTEQHLQAQNELDRFGEGVDTGLRLGEFGKLYVQVDPSQVYVTRSYDWGMRWFPDFVGQLCWFADGLEIGMEDVRLVFAFDN